MRELLFSLEQDEDDWPPFAVEGIWCQPSDGLYRVKTCPLFVKGLSVDDAIRVKQDDHGDVRSFSVIAPSGNSTIWLIFWDRSAIDVTLQQMRLTGCQTTGPLEGMEAKLCSINVPANIDFAEVDALLKPLEASERVAVAHPSHRHPDS